MAPTHCDELAADQQKLLREVVRQSVESGLKGDKYSPSPDVIGKALFEPGASFVTLTCAGKLRGCIGTLEARQPLAADVASNAFNAAFHDPRFKPLSREEWEACDYSISVLTVPEPAQVATETELLEALRPGKDGLILTYGHHRATFLPSVWSQLCEPSDFVNELKVKAGLPRDFWSDSMSFQFYQVKTA